MLNVMKARSEHWSVSDERRVQNTGVCPMKAEARSERNLSPSSAVHGFLKLQVMSSLQIHISLTGMRIRHWSIQKSMRPQARRKGVCQRHCLSDLFHYVSGRQPTVLCSLALACADRHVKMLSANALTVEEKTHSDCCT